MNQTLIQEILEVVEQAAIASAKLTGLGQKDEADAAAVEAMRLRMGKIEMKGKIVIGEGESCLLYTSPSPRDSLSSRMPSSA